MDRTETILRNLLSALPAHGYDLGILSGNGMHRSESVAASAILRTLRYLKHRNASGAHIYFRPTGESAYTLLDDLNTDTLARLEIATIDLVAPDVPVDAFIADRSKERLSMLEPSSDLFRAPTQVQLLLDEGDHRRRHLRRAATPISLTLLRAGLCLVVVILAVHLVPSPLPPDGRTVNLQVASDLRVRDAPFREN